MWEREAKELYYITLNLLADLPIDDSGKPLYYNILHAFA